MKKNGKIGIFVVSENTHHYFGAPSGTRYTFMKGRGLWVVDPTDIEFFRGKVERGSGFRIEKENLSMKAESEVKVVKKEEEEEAPKKSLTEKIKEKVTGSKKAVEEMSKEELQKALDDIVAVETEVIEEAEATEEQLIEILEEAATLEFACELCGKSFDNEKSLNGHMGWHAREENKEAAATEVEEEEVEEAKE